MSFNHISESLIDRPLGSRKFHSGFILFGTVELLSNDLKWIESLAAIKDVVITRAKQYPPAINYRDTFA